MPWQRASAAGARPNDVASAIFRNRAATLFMLRAVQDWGQSEPERVAAVQGVLDAAGFDAKAHASPVFGSVWPSQRPCTGPDGTVAQKWLEEMTSSMPRGELNAEVDHVEKAIAAHATADEIRL